MNLKSDEKLKVFLTFDVEIWCGDWDDIDGRFPQAFQRYIYGSSRAGNFALPKTLEILNANELKGIFFIEPLFAAHFGVEPLAEIVGLIRDAGHEIQLHLHPEWQDEAKTPLIDNHEGKRQHLSMYDVDEQTALIGHGLRLLREAGAGGITAFRAGSFSCNRDTFAALTRNGLRYDSSLNVTIDRSGMDFSATERRVGAHRMDGVMELPLSVSRHMGGGLRHMQIGSCSFEEMKQAMESARSKGWRYFNFLSHNFEMLVPNGTKPDRIVVKRFDKLCSYLDKNRDLYTTTDFSSEEIEEEPSELKLPETSAGVYFMRNAEQGFRRFADKLLGLTAG